ncbi:organic solute transport protein 1-domain-containing protein [Tribonema minus]|uniref:Organic solute transport protein 1-domain-containing protein n=1 Tax=Tribonema minus TaxID=303371 RepID=A0A836CQM8_9STRA|nr:organic solute transport protein 1-domain-containing protein [Tribonema minus]
MTGPPAPGSLLAMPMLVLNMGCEMLYILNQRLLAQNVPEDKSNRVLADVTRTMFATEVFKKLAHSSIMCLNDNSMDKLYDLITMGFKFQVIQVNQPHQLMQVLLNHLESIRRILCASDATSEALLVATISLCISTYGAFDSGEWFELRQKLLLFFEGRKTKVSLFLQHEVQRNDGVIVLNPRGNVPKGGQIPGTITFYEGSNVAHARLVRMPLADKCLPAQRTFLDPSCPLGMNFYAKDACALDPGAEGIDRTSTSPCSLRRSDATREAELTLRQSALQALQAQAHSRSYNTSASEALASPTSSGDSAQHSAVAGLNILASLIGTSTKGVRLRNSHDLSDAASWFYSSEVLLCVGGCRHFSRGTITIDLKEGRDTAAKVIDDWSSDDEEETAQRTPLPRRCAEDKASECKGGDDLLDLMDSLK